ncbi:MAG: acyltransferase [Lachnospiraceae bacterium]|nr:acyltransferase [Lachnospiraceae bacterium]
MKKLENIQLLRALACIGVFVTHLAPRMEVQGLAARIANFGASGVYLFFLISGYLVCMQKDIGRDSSFAQIKNFYIKRLLRILPLYYAVVLVNIVLHTFLLQDVTPDPQKLYWLRYFFLTNALIPAPDNFWSNLSATWTISLFVVFYLTAPLWRRLIRGVKSAAAVYLAALAVRYLWAQTPLNAYMMCLYYLHFFLLGMLLWEMKEHLARRQATVLLTAGGAAVWGAVKLCGLEPDYFTTWSWVFALIVLWTQDLSLGCGVVKKTVSLTDRYSYSIYLVHALVIDGIVLLQGKIQIPAFAVLLLAVILTFAGVLAVEVLVERPVKKLSTRLAAPERI